MKITRHRYWRR